MGIIDALFGMSKQKAMRLNQLEAVLRETTWLSPADREYLKAAFGKYLKDGVTKEEAAKEFLELRKNYKDAITDTEIEKLKAKIMSFFL
ncbi:MAG: hypothetical protein Q7S84_02540 [bacterium]|nr:hypothetical protein [bacterium]